MELICIKLENVLKQSYIYNFCAKKEVISLPANDPIMFQKLTADVSTMIAIQLLHFNHLSELYRVIYSFLLNFHSKYMLAKIIMYFLYNFSKLMKVLSHKTFNHYLMKMFPVWGKAVASTPDCFLLRIYLKHLIECFVLL